MSINPIHEEAGPQYEIVIHVSHEKVDFADPEILDKIPIHVLIGSLSYLLQGIQNMNLIGFMQGGIDAEL